MVELNGTLLIQIFNFIILCAILGFFCYKPVLKVLDDRKARIKNDLDSAAQSKAAAEELKVSYEAQLKDAQAKAQEIVDKAVKEAHASIAKAKEQASQQIERERKDALEDLKAQVAVLSCDIAAKIISKNMTPDANDRLIAESIAKLDAKKAGK